MKNIHQWNTDQLKSKQTGVNAAFPKAVVRVIGDLKKATLVDDTVVERVDAIFVEGYGLVKCIPYELHFIYEVPKHFKGWKYMCTCGSIAGVAGAKAYSKLITPSGSGLMLVCVRHSTTKSNEGIGHHADESTE